VTQEDFLVYTTFLHYYTSPAFAGLTAVKVSDGFSEGVVSEPIISGNMLSFGIIFDQGTSPGAVTIKLVSALSGGHAAFCFNGPGIFTRL
jgi:hypothetical protein